MYRYPTNVRSYTLICSRPFVRLFHTSPHHETTTPSDANEGEDNGRDKGQRPIAPPLPTHSTASYTGGPSRSRAATRPSACPRPHVPKRETGEWDPIPHRRVGPARAFPSPRRGEVASSLARFALPPQPPGAGGYK